jgi:hypothetical protein
MATFLFPYKPASESAKNIAMFGKIKMIRHEKSVFKGSDDKTVINWGFSGDLPDEVMKCGRVLNKASAVRAVSNKLSFFQRVSDAINNGEPAPRTPLWTRDKEVVAAWLADGKTAFARTILNAHSGRGIVDVISPETLAPVPDGTLFTQYVPKKQEWRIHVGHTGEAFLIQRKAYRAPDRGILDPIIPNWRIRNHDNHFVFERNHDRRPHQDIVEQAKLAIRCFGLDFGAVDVVFNERREQAYVLEINTAPGVEGTTVEDYVDMFSTL